MRINQWKKHNETKKQTAQSTAYHSPGKYSTLTLTVMHKRRNISLGWFTSSTCRIDHWIQSIASRFAGDDIQGLEKRTIVRRQPTKKLDWKENSSELYPTAETSHSNSQERSSNIPSKSLNIDGHGGCWVGRWWREYSLREGAEWVRREVSMVAHLDRKLLSHVFRYCISSVSTLVRWCWPRLSFRPPCLQNGWSMGLHWWAKVIPYGQLEKLVLNDD
jgi:hypothetical protein